jgi:hypothetical protein
MIPEYQFFHGAFLHEIIVTAGSDVIISLKDIHGRRNAFAINDKIGVLIKHSSARLTPWSFTFTKENLAELLALRAETNVCFVALVCDDDGFVCIRDSDLIEILSPKHADAVAVRVDRRPRKMYRVSSSGNSLDRKLAKGVHEIVAEIKRFQSAGSVNLHPYLASQKVEIEQTSSGDSGTNDSFSA